MTKREDTLARHILFAVVGIAVTVLWNLNASDQVQASQIGALETAVQTMAPEVTQIRIILEAEEISRKHRNGVPHGY